MNVTACFRQNKNAAKGRILLALLLAAILFPFPAAAEGADDRHPAITLMGYYDKEWPRMDFFEPHAVSLLALNELENGRHFKEVKVFLKWYFSHLNYPDKHGFTGTIYDYEFKWGKEQATRKYSSINAYAGRFLYLLARYAEITGDKAFIAKNIKKINDIAYTIVVLIDKDGLTRSLPTIDLKRLTDNCEAYGGLKAYGRLLLYAKAKTPPFLPIVLEGLAAAIAALYDPKENTFAQSVLDGRTKAAPWADCPGAFAQLYAVFYGLLDGDPELAEEFWYNFNLAHAESMGRAALPEKLFYLLTEKKAGVRYIEHAILK
ncbi:MAG: hypothetical protein LBO03_02060 [Acidaminococcales bacterium]|jgi:hypothetical protein|nr:hypothetical protein [Acidaminococcales bacterium]